MLLCSFESGASILNFKGLQNDNAQDQNEVILLYQMEV